MIAGMLLLGVGAYFIFAKADNQLKFAQHILAQRRTVARTGINTPLVDEADDDVDSAVTEEDDDTDGFDEDFEAP